MEKEEELCRAICTIFNSDSESEEDSCSKQATKKRRCSQVGLFRPLSNAGRYLRAPLRRACNFSNLQLSRIHAIYRGMLLAAVLPLQDSSGACCMASQQILVTTDSLHLLTGSWQAARRP